MSIPKWTAEPPSAPGWYWLRSPKFGVVMADVYRHGGRLYVYARRISAEPQVTMMCVVGEEPAERCEWYGPLEYPK